MNPFEQPAAGWLETNRSRRVGLEIRITPIRIALVLSLLLHLSVLWHWWPDLVRTLAEPDVGKGNAPISVVLAPPPAPPVPPSAAQAPSEPPSPPPQKAAPPKPAPRARPAPKQPVLAMQKAPTAIPAPKAAPAPAPAPTPAPAPAPAQDFASFVEARRRAREAQQQPSAPSAPQAPGPSDSDNARASRMLAGDIANDQAAMRARADPSRRGGGVFEITRKSYHDAEFIFYGWNKEFRRNWATPIPVQQGNNATIELAIVRKMISIIREYESGDFVWYSSRLERTVTLSAAARDNAGLENFMLQEFFAATSPTRLQ